MSTLTCRNCKTTMNYIGKGRWRCESYSCPTIEVYGPRPLVTEEKLGGPVVIEKEEPIVIEPCSDCGDALEAHLEGGRCQVIGCNCRLWVKIPQTKTIRMEGDTIVLVQLAQQSGIKATTILMDLLSSGREGVHINTPLDRETVQGFADAYGMELEDREEEDGGYFYDSPMADTEPELHLYAQDFSHSEAYIVGNMAGLRDLRDALNAVLETKQAGGVSAYAADGEATRFSSYL